MYIETPRLVLRDFTLADAADLHEILGDAETMKNCEPAYDFEKTQKFLASFCIGQKGAVAVVSKEYGKVIGYILFSGFGEGVYEMGWFFNRSYWGQGYAYESCKAIVDYAFTELNAHKIFAETIDVTKSLGLMQKLEMRFEGIQRSQVKDPEGNWADMYLYGLLKTDWEALSFP